MSSRSAYALASAMIGVAIGLFVYRYAVLPLAWSSPLKNVVPGAAAGLVFGARQVMRGHERPALPIVLGAGVAGIAAALGVAYLALPTLGGVALAKHDFPGFSLAVPSGEIKTDDHDYPRGKLAIADVGGLGGVVVVAWQPGDAFSERELAAMAEGLRAALPAVKGHATPTTVPGPDGKPVGSIQMGDDGWMSMLQCGHREVIVATIGAHGSEVLHRRIVATLVCHPDTSKEAALSQATYPLVLDLPGWYAISRDPVGLQISDGRAELTMKFVEPNLMKTDLGQILGPAMRSQGADVTFDAPKDGRVPMRMKVDGQELVGWARVFTCGTTGEVLILLAPTQALSDEVYGRIEHAHCAGPVEAPQVWPDAPKP